VSWGDVAVSVAQVAAGGTIVQAVVALTKRRSELKQLDRGSDSVAVETADHVVGLVREELDTAKAENRELKKELADQQRQIQALAEQVSTLRTDLAIAKSEIHRLQDEGGSNGN
jgi:predicted RNase H-like nuclease (RuvC/YqgF family)